MGTKTGKKTYYLVMIAVMAAVIAAVAPLAVPIGPVPITLCTLTIYLSVYVLGWKRATMAVLVYILLGIVGMPVFTGFQGGPGKVLGPTGGYIAGYLPLAVLSGWAVELAPKRRVLQYLGMVLATAVLYALGTAWFCFLSGNTLNKALHTCVLLFIPGDLIKMVIAVTLGPLLREQLSKADLYPQR